MWSWRAVLLKNSCSSEGPTVQMLHKAIKIAEIELNWLLAKQLYLTEQKRSQSWKWNIPGNVRGLLWYLGQEALVRNPYSLYWRCQNCLSFPGSFSSHLFAAFTVEMWDLPPAIYYSESSKIFDNFLFCSLCMCPSMEKRPFKRILSRIRSIHTGQAISADEVLNIRTKNEIGNVQFVVVLKKKVLTAELSILILSGSVLSRTVLD